MRFFVLGVCALSLFTSAGVAEGAGPAIPDPLAIAWSTPTNAGLAELRAEAGYRLSGESFGTLWLETGDLHVWYQGQNSAWTHSLGMLSRQGDVWTLAGGAAEGYSASVYVAPAIPEPGAAMLMGAAGMALFTRRARRACR